MAGQANTSPGKGEVGAPLRVGVSKFDHTRQKTARARKLRRAATPAEAKLWSHLRNNNMHGLAFRRQHPLGKYVLDFFCTRVRLAVELDGGQHADPLHKKRDLQRDTWLAQQGVEVLRFWNHDVLTTIGPVLDAIWFAIERRLQPDPHPLLRSDLPLAGGGSEYPTSTPSPGKGEVGAPRRVGVSKGHGVAA
ncbi:MAG: endonuclease domain-containing protein [Hyphomicrobiales bacterium]